MNQLKLFNPEASESAKQTGIDRAASAKPRLLDLARQIAAEIVTPNGITADDVIFEMVKRGYSVHCLGNSAGSLFRGKEWQCVGFRKSARIHAHSNLLRVWVLG